MNFTFYQYTLKYLFFISKYVKEIFFFQIVYEEKKNFLQ